MIRTVFLGCVFTLFLSTVLTGQTFKQKPVVNGEWITDWLLCSPFDLVKNDDVFVHCTGFETDFLQKIGGEKALKVKAGDVVKFKGGSNTWKFYTSSENILNLDNAISTKEPVCAYAYTEIYVDEPGFRKISFGSNDGGRLWVNSQQAWDYAPNRGVYPDQNQLPVLLNKGKNTILFKIEDKGGIWRLACRFFPLDGSDLNVKESPLSINYQKDGTLGLTSVNSPDQLKSVISHIQIKVSENGKMKMDENLEEDFFKRINLKSTFYRQVKGVIDITLKNGDKLHSEQELFIGERKVYSLFENGKSAYSIVLGKSASESEQFAAKEFQDVIQKAAVL